MKFTIDKHNWKLVKLGEVVTKKEENDRDNAQTRFDRFLKVEHMDSGSLHIKRWASQKSGDEINPTFYKIFRKGQILFPTRNPHLKRTALASFDGICGEKTLTLEANEDLILQEFLPFIFHSESFYAHTTSSIVGSTNPHCRWRDVAEFEFLLPPKEQQSKLAGLLWSLDDLIEMDKGLLQKCRLAKSVDFENFVTEADGESMPLSKILRLKKSKSPVPHQRKKYIGLEHITSGAYTCNTFGDSSEVKAQCNLVDIGDLCYSKLRPYLDKAFISDFEAVSTTELLVYETEFASKEYVLHHFHSKAFVDYVTGKGFGTKMPRVNQKIIGEYVVKVLADERPLINRMSKYAEVELLCNDRINANINLNKSITNKVF
tara:strand:+ start:3378 stop:4499 length:1122 start_codon:yes stop_codon:yes gene_type:complete